MTGEYVRLSHNERKEGESNFLNVELDVLNLIKGSKSYLKLRSEEFKLKVSLKSQVESMLESLDRLGKILPKTDYHKLEMMGRVERKKEKEKLGLQQEIDKIRAKIERLHEDM